MLSSLEPPAADSLRLKLYSNRAAAQLPGRNPAAVEADARCSAQAITSRTVLHRPTIRCTSGSAGQRQVC